MTSRNILRAYLLGLKRVGCAGYSSSVKPLPGEEGAATEQASEQRAALRRINLATVPPLLVHQEAPAGLERYILRIDHLSAALNDPDYDWEGARAPHPMREAAETQT